MRKQNWYTTMLISGLCMIASGCITDATTELTKAPFDATSQLTNGTTAALSEFTDPLTDFTSSTTPGAEGGIVPSRAKKRLQIFTASSYENLRADISHGHGEYLVSLATLAGVPSGQVRQFQTFMQDSYSTMFEEEIPIPESNNQIVEIAWAAGYGQRR
jgi:hypothetical protein